MQQPNVIFWIVFAVMAVIIYLCNKKYNLLKDPSAATPSPYSYARVQLAWWTLIIISSFVTCYLISGQIPTFNQSTLMLLGISAGTTTVASIIDVSDQTNGTAVSQNTPGQNFILDILSDNNGISIHRLQAVIFNIIIGAWFIEQANHQLADYHTQTALCITGTADVIAHCKMDVIDKIMPVVTNNNLILMGVSAGTYAALKTNENKQTPASAVPVAAPPAIPANIPAAPVAAIPVAAPVIVPDVPVAAPAPGDNTGNAMQI